MYYIIQENIFKEQNFFNLIEALDRLNIEYEVIKVLPFIDEIEFETKRKDIICFGSIKLTRIAKKYDWNPGVFLNNNYDFNVYKNYYKDNLLNFDSEITSIEELNEFDGQLFIRPSKDDKAINGQIVNAKKWKELKEQCVNYGVDLKTKIQLSSVKNINSEHRLWVVNKKVVTASRYKVGIGSLNFPPDQELINFGQKMCEIFCLDQAFVMDVCYAEKGPKIVECGCINCAGFYNADLQKLIISLEDNFNGIFLR